MKYTRLIGCLIAMLVFSSCDKFLEVQTPDRIMENNLFQSTDGFKAALNGVYIEMASDNLYGKEMSAGAIDAMAQYYITGTNYLIYRNFSYTDAVNKAYFNTAWSKYYNLIANVNTILEKAQSSTVLSATNNNIVQGEALALRAFLHFDVLRLWGPIYSSTTKGNTSIPYYTRANQEVQPLLSAESVMDSVVNDLNKAADLLKISDPVVSEGRKNVSDPVNGDFLSFRQFRLNYFAVKALLARVYLWKQDYTMANETAQQVIQSASTFFPFVSTVDANNGSTPDRLFTSEILFAAYDNTRQTMFNTIISPNASSVNRLYVQGNTVGRVNEMYDDTNDFRYIAFATQTVGANSFFYNRKYESVGNSYDYYIPLIRMSEMYYIAAECASSLTTATNYLNAVRAARSARNLSITTQTALNTALRDEYRREFLSEGQLFFFYKRKALASVPDGATASANININLANYVVPMVESETRQRN